MPGVRCRDVGAPERGESGTADRLGQQPPGRRPPPGHARLSVRVRELVDRCPRGDTRPVPPVPTAAESARRRPSTAQARDQARRLRRPNRADRARPISRGHSPAAPTSARSASSTTGPGRRLAAPGAGSAGARSPPGNGPSTPRTARTGPGGTSGARAGSPAAYGPMAGAVRVRPGRPAARPRCVLSGRRFPAVPEFRHEFRDRAGRQFRI